ncbi:MAG: hypothetical protein AAF195_03950 [Pseudomonadota bacterium]
MINNNEIFKNRMTALLNELSSKSYQIEVWSKGNNIFNGRSILFSEAVIELFDDALVSEALEANAVIYDKDVTQALHELSDAVDLVDDNRIPIEIINDPLMQKVRDKAKEILELIEISDVKENTVTFIEEGTLNILDP